METRSISFEGTRADVKAVNDLAESLGMTTARFMRQLVDDRYGEALKPRIAYHAQAGNKNSQSEPEIVNEASHARRS